MNQTLVISVLVLIGFFIIVGAKFWWEHQLKVQALKHKQDMELKKQEKGK